MRVAILYSETGGGHKAAARAIEAALKEIDPAIEVGIRDGLVEGTVWPLRKAPQIYAWSMSHGRWLWALLFHLWNGPVRSRWMVDLGMPVIGKRLRRFLSGIEADVIVSVHPLLTRSVALSLAKLERKVPFAIVVTDLLTGHWSWYERSADRFLIPTEPLRETMVKGGIDPSRILVTGQPVHPRSGRVLAQREEIRRRFSWTGTVILLVGGGDGTGDLGSRVRAAARAGLDARLVVVCGRNEELRRELSGAGLGPRVEVFGFVDNLPEMMAAADILVTKGGPGSIMEGCVAGLPILVYDFIPGQERGNVELVETSGAGHFAKTPDDLVQRLRAWLADPAAQRKAGESARRLGRPDSAKAIAEAILALAAGPR